MNSIATLWIGDALSTMEQLCLASFVHHGHTTTLFVYNDVRDVPPGVAVEDASTILPRSAIFKNRRGSYAAFADHFRWQMLYQRGGFWVDTDVVCLKPFTFPNEPVFGWQDDSTINIAVVGLPAGSVIAKDLTNMCLHPFRTLPYDSLSTRIRKTLRRFRFGNDHRMVGWGEGGGVAAFTDHIHHLHLDHHALPPATFYPVAMDEWRSFTDGSLRLNDERLHDSHAVHLWNEFFRRNGHDKQAPYQTGSFLDDCLQRFL